MTTIPATEAGPRPPAPGPRRPRIGFLLAGIALAVTLAVILFGGAWSPSQVPAVAEVAPGIDQPTAQVLSLDVTPPEAVRAAPDFALTDQQGQPMALSQFRGKVVVLSFNDDQCPNLCTLLAQDIVAADRDLGAAAGRVAFVSVNVNPFYPGVGAVRAWTNSHGLGGLPNWYFGTASPAVLRPVWAEYGIYVALDTQARTVTHGTQLFFIDPSGHQRAVGDFEMSSANTAFFAHAMAQMAVDLLPASAQARVGGPTTPPPAAGNVAPGAPAPAFRLPALRPGAPAVSLAGLRGKPTVSNFWASTCAPCRAELPALEAAYRDLRAKVNFVGIDVADDAPAARTLARAAGLTYRLARDQAGTVAASYRVSATPFTVIVGPDGVIKVVHPEAFTTEQLEYVLESYYSYLVPSGS